VGRRESPIPADCPRKLAALAGWLRDRRAAAGLTYAGLAAKTGYSVDTLKRAASGSGLVPRKNVVEVFAAGCQAEVPEVERLWKQARYEQTRAEDDRRNRFAMHIDVVSNFAELQAAMLDRYRKDGAQPYRDLEKQAGRGDDGTRRLTHSTLARVLAGKTRPSRAFVLAFAETCGAKDPVAWGEAWDRAQRQHQPTSREALGKVWSRSSDKIADLFQLHSQHDAEAQAMLVQVKDTRRGVISARELERWIQGLLPHSVDSPPLIIPMGPGVRRLSPRPGTALASPPPQRDPRRPR
jgi:transcriptional regulator with XRE-family HTH domain